MLGSIGWNRAEVSSASSTIVVTSSYCEITGRQFHTMNHLTIHTRKSHCRSGDIACLKPGLTSRSDSPRNVSRLLSLLVSNPAFKKGIKFRPFDRLRFSGPCEIGNIVQPRASQLGHNCG